MNNTQLLVIEHLLLLSTYSPISFLWRYKHRRLITGEYGIYISILINCVLLLLVFLQHIRDVELGEGIETVMDRKTMTK